MLNLCLGLFKIIEICSMDNLNESHPLLKLSGEDLSMVSSFVLVSGSIKALAQQYGVSYPTMRQRLDGLIDRLGRLVDGGEPDPVSDFLADLIAKGQIAPSVAQQIRTLHRQQLSKSPERTDQGVSPNE